MICSNMASLFTQTFPTDFPLKTRNIMFCICPCLTTQFRSQLACRGHVRFRTITSGLRKGKRKSLWRSRVLSSEAMQVVQSLKLSKSSPEKLKQVVDSRLARLLKTDLVDTFTELKRQNEFDLVLLVFEYMRMEVWYKPDLAIYCDMILMLGKRNLVQMAEALFLELKTEGLKPDTRTYTEMIGAYLNSGMTEKAMEMYKSMKAAGCDPDKLTLTILIRNLEKSGERELASTVKKECIRYMDFPEKFLEQIARTYGKEESTSFE